jgi:hypothetical protein
MLFVCVFLSLGAKHSFLPAEIVVKNVKNPTRFFACGKYILLYTCKKCGIATLKILPQ